LWESSGNAIEPTDTETEMECGYRIVRTNGNSETCGSMKVQPRYSDKTEKSNRMGKGKRE